MNKKDRDNLLNNSKEIIFTQCDSDDKNIHGKALPDNTLLLSSTHSFATLLADIITDCLC